MSPAQCPGTAATSLVGGICLRSSVPGLVLTPLGCSRNVAHGFCRVYLHAPLVAVSLKLTQITVEGLSCPVNVPDCHLEMSSANDSRLKVGMTSLRSLRKLRSKVQLSALPCGSPSFDGLYLRPDLSLREEAFQPFTPNLCSFRSSPFLQTLSQAFFRSTKTATVW